MFGKIKNLFRNFTLENNHQPTSVNYGLGFSNSVNKSALSFAAVYACVKLITDDLGSLPFRVYKRGKDGVSVDTKHSQSYLLGYRPNELYSSGNYIKALVANLLLKGDAFARIIRDEQTGDPIRFVLVPNSRIVPFIHGLGDGSELMYYYDNKKNEIIHCMDMIHLVDYTDNGCNGVSRIGIAKQTIDGALSAIDYQNNYLTNGTYLGGYIKVDSNVNNKNLDKLKEEFIDKYKGSGKAGQIAVLPKGLDFKKMDYSMSFGDAQFIENRKLSIEEIARIFKVPPHKIGHVTNATFNNMEHQNIDYVQNTLSSIVSLIEDEHNYKCFNVDERNKYFTKINLNGLLRGDLKTRSKFYKDMWGIGVLSRNEIRKLEDMKRVDDGDVYYIPLNYGTTEEE